MDYQFSTTPSTFQADLAAAEVAQQIPAALVTAIQSAWDATTTSDPDYLVAAATGDLWTVVRIAAVREG